MSPKKAAVHHFRSCRPKWLNKVGIPTNRNFINKTICESFKTKNSSVVEKLVGAISPQVRKVVGQLGVVLDGNHDYEL